MKKYLLPLLLIVSMETLAASVERPSTQYPSLSLFDYSWLASNKRNSFEVYVSKDAKRFMSEESLRRYFRLKMRNFAKDVELLDETDPSDLDHNYLTLEFEIYPYNDTSSIYYGITSLRIAAPALSNSRRIYKITLPISGSDEQMVSFFKHNINIMVEALAEDYYYIEDLIAEQDELAEPN